MSSQLTHFLIALTLAGTRLYGQPYAYAVDIYNNNVTVIDTSSNKVVTTMGNFISGIPNSFSAGPCNVAVTPDGTQAFVSNFINSAGAYPQLDVVTAINAKTNKTTTIPIDPSLGTYHLAISPDSKYLYVPLNTGQTYLVLIIDTAMKTVIKKFGVNGSPGRMAVTSDGSQLWVPYLGDTKVDVFDAAGGSMLNRMDLGSRVDAVVFSPDGATAYVSSDQVPSVFAINVASGKVSTISASVPGAKGNGIDFADLAISPDGNRLYISQNPSPRNNIAVIDLKSQTVTAPLPEGAGGENVSTPFAITPDGSRIFAVDQTFSNVSIAAYDTSTFSLIGKNVLTGLNNTFFICGLATQPLAAQKAPPPAISSVVNGASFQTGFAAGAWTTIRGSNLSSTTRIWGPADFVGNKLPTALDGVSVTIDGLSAYVYYISPNQLNVLAPDDSATGTVPVQVTNAAGMSNVFLAAKAAFSPAFFTLDPTHPIATHADGSLIGPPGLLSGVTTTPAKPGETIVLYGTGFGQSNPPLPSGLVVASPARLANVTTILLNSLPANVLFSGITGSGLDQFNIIVPAVADGDATISAQVSSAQTQSGLVIAVHK